MESMHPTRLVAKYNCRQVYLDAWKEVAAQAARLPRLGRSAADSLVVVANAADLNGGRVAMAMLSDDQKRDAFRRGVNPYCVCLAERTGADRVLREFDALAADKLRATPGLCCVVIDYGVAEIFLVEGA